jgi:hypothetical protein
MIPNKMKHACEKSKRAQTATCQNTPSYRTSPQCGANIQSTCPEQTCHEFDASEKFIVGMKLHLLDPE